MAARRRKRGGWALAWLAGPGSGSSARIPGASAVVRWGRLVVALAVCLAGLVPVAPPAAAAALKARLVPAAARAAGAAASGSVAPAARGTVQASALAAASRRAVEVMADRTDWSQTWAEPGGGFLSHISVVPVRVKRPDGSWVRVDTTLSARPDGSVAPGAIVPGLVLSGGGRGPLLKVSQATGDPAGSVSLSWPYGPLPVPSLSGATATYANVLPGVNLLVTAEPTGVDAVLQVMSAAAAADPRLARIRFPVSAPGLKVAADGHGGLTMTDRAGKALFGEPPAQMWDSAGMTASPGPAAARAAGAAGRGVPAGLAGPVPGDHVGIARAVVRAGSVTLSPTGSVLAGPRPVYPVYIDPGISDKHTQAGWLDVAHDFNGYSSSGNGGPCAAQGGSWNCWGNWDYEDPLGGIRAGVFCNGPATPQQPPPTNIICGNYPGPPDSSWGVYRTYLNFTLPSGLSGADYVDAQLGVYNLHSYACSDGSTLQLWQTDEATQDEYWGNRPADRVWQDSSTASYGGPGCNPGGITLNATNAVSAAAASGSGEVTLGLQAKDTSEDARPPDLTNWRRFQATATGGTCAAPGTGGAPCLAVFWMHKPAQATDPETEGTFDATNGQTVTHCATNPNSPDYVSTMTPKLDASVTDQDSGLASFKGWIQWSDLTTGSGASTFGGGDVQSLTNSFTDQVPSGTFTIPDFEYEWQAQGVARATDTISNDSVAEPGPWSSPCYVIPDPPSDGGVRDVVGTVQVTPPSSWTVGQAEKLTFTDPDYSVPLSPDSDVVGFFYAVGSSDPVQYVQATNGTAQVTIRPYTESTESVYVVAVDAAGNRGPFNTDSAGTVIPNYEFTPAPPNPSNIATLAYWPLNGTRADMSLLGNELTLTPNALFVCGSPANPAGYTCSLGLEADTSAGVVSPQFGFTASAWATTDNWPCTNTTCVVMSEDADPKNTNHSSVFWLGYVGGTGVAGYPGPTAQCPCWVFEVWPSDSSTSKPYVAAISATPAQQQGAWAQLDGVFDPSSLTVTLYVNGSHGTLPGPGQQSRLGPWQTTIPGAVRLAAGPPGNSGWYPWAGNVSDACVIFGALSAPSDIATLHLGDGTTTTDGCKAIFNQYH